MEENCVLLNFIEIKNPSDMLQNQTLLLNLKRKTFKLKKQQQNGEKRRRAETVERDE